MLRRFLSVIFFLVSATLLALLHYILAQQNEKISINVLLVFTFFISIIFRYTWALALAALGTFFIDQFSYPFGITAIPIFTALIITNFLFISFFTNRSLWTLLLLGNIATIISYGMGTMLMRSWQFFITQLGTQMIAHSIMFILLFVATNALTNRLKPYLLLSR